METGCLEARRPSFGSISRWLTCSRTSSLGDASSCTKIGTAPLSITTRVCSDVPDATFVSAQAASNWTGPTPVSTTAVRQVSSTRAGSADLQLGHIGALQELHKPRDDPLANHLLDGGISLCSMHSAVSTRVYTR